MARQTTVRIETISLLILRAKGSGRAWCPRCGAEGDVIALEGIGVVSNLDHSAVEEWLKSPNLHRIEGNNGSPGICLTSLLSHFGYPKQLEENGAAEEENR